MKKEIFLSKGKWFSISGNSACIDNKIRNDFHKKSYDEIKTLMNDQQMISKTVPIL